MDATIDYVRLLIVIVGAGCSVVMLGVAAYRLVQTRGAKRWREARGRVVSSDVETRETVGPGQEKEKGVANYPRVVYEYTVDGKRYEGRRIGPIDASPDLDVEQTLARYPVGAVVPVYYDSDDAAHAVIDRGLPRGLGRVVVWALAIIPALTAGAVYGSALFVDVMTRHGHADDDAAFMLIFGASGWGLLAAAAGAQWKARTERRWPVTAGRVLSSGVEQYVAASGTRTSKTRMTLYRPAIVYEYEVRGRRYRSSHIASQPELRVVVPDLAARTVERYGTGSTPAVRYNPANPAEAVLETRVPAFWRLVVLAGGFLALAVIMYLRKS
jgi:hypothetical protein